MTQREFDRIFGYRPLSRSGYLFFQILTLTVILTISLIILIANLDYDELRADAHRAVEAKFHRKLVELAIERSYSEILEESGPPGPPISESAEPEQVEPKSAREKILEDVNKKGVLGELGKSDPYADLPTFDEGEIDLGELSYTPEPGKPATRFFRRKRNEAATYLANSAEDLLRIPMNTIYTVTRKIVIEVPKGLIAEEKEERGYRDQDEILKVIYSKSGIIESCYQRAARKVNVNRGYVKVEFKISPDGYVISESIRIIDSTIRNRIVEQCIKKNIGRWRSFEKLDESRGVAKVVHKFVFN